MQIGIQFFFFSYKDSSCIYISLRIRLPITADLMQFYTQIRVSSLNSLFISITRMNLTKTHLWLYRKHSETNPYYNTNKTSHSIREKVMRLSKSRKHSRSAPMQRNGRAALLGNLVNHAYVELRNKLSLFIPHFIVFSSVLAFFIE